MTTLTMNPTRPAVSAHRARIVGDAVTSAYIREIASAAAPASDSAARPTAGRAPAPREVRGIAVDRRPLPLRRLKQPGVVSIRRRPSSPLAARQLRIAAGAPALDTDPARQIDGQVRDVSAGHKQCSWMTSQASGHGRCLPA